MFKKTLAGLAVAGLFSGAAMAADVNLYGVIDTGLLYTHTDYDGVDETNDFTMESGMNAGSRFGLKGSEDLGNGLTVSFKLENGFSSDSGKLGYDNRLFGREASVTLSGNFGQFSFGRMGGVASAAGTYDIVYVAADAYDGFDNNIGGLVSSSRYDNMIVYQTPTFGGLKVTAQHSLKGNTVKADASDTSANGTEGKSNTNRYTSFAVDGQWGALQLVAAYEQQNFATDDQDRDDQHTFYVGGNYDFGVTKLFAMAQHFSGVRDLNGWEVTHKDGIDGLGATIGAQTPVAGGLLYTSFYYVDADAKVAFNATEADDHDYKYYGLAARYEYSLSKRTTVYGGAGYAQEEASGLDGNIAQAYVGLKHTF